MSKQFGQLRPSNRASLALIMCNNMNLIKVSKQGKQFDNLVLDCSAVFHYF